MPETVEVLMSRPDIHPGIHPFLFYRDDGDWQERARLKNKRWQRENSEELGQLFSEYQTVKRVPRYRVFFFGYERVVGRRWVGLLTWVGMRCERIPERTGFFGFIREDE